MIIYMYCKQYVYITVRSNMVNFFMYAHSIAYYAWLWIKYFRCVLDFNNGHI